MSRPLRIEFENAWYHVMNRGLARQPVFQDRCSYEIFLETLSEAHQRYELEIHAYCLMTNHYHLLVRTPRANLGRAMRHVNGIYTQRFNRSRRRDGPLFRGRYKAIVVDADEYLLAVGRYIHRNPVDGRRPLVECPADYPWSSYRAYLGQAAAPGWLHRAETYAMLGRRDRYRAYKRFVERSVTDDLGEFYAQTRKPPVLGGDAFRERLLAGVNPVAAEVAASEHRASRQLAPEHIEAVVAGEFGVEAAALRRRAGRGRSAFRPERALAMWLCRERAAMTQATIGARYGNIHYSGVSQAIGRLRSRMDEDREFAARVNAVLSRLDP